MSLRSLIPQLPLLRRELTELANRRATYIIRIVGALILLTLVLIAFQNSVMNVTGGWFASGASTGVPGNKYFGIGGEVFKDIVPWLFHSVQLLMPALVCGSITMEKERNTLGTLLLTRLSPFTIVLEKLGSRMVPMVTFLLLTFPLLAYVYSLGGVDTSVLLSTIWLLSCECLLYASIGLMCSAWFMTTVSAFVCSYVIVLLLLMSSGAMGVLTLTPFDIWQGFVASPANPGFGVRRGLINLFLNAVANFGVIGVIAISVPSLTLSVICVLMSRIFLIRRAFITPTSPILKLFKLIDRFFVSLNNRTTRGIEIIKDSNTLPTFDPIAWRELTRKSLGKARYLFRVLTALEVPTIFICALAAISNGATGFSGLRVLMVMLWALVVLVITVKASTAISSERSRETIEPLLASPMTSRQIFLEKVKGMKRLMLMLAVPIGTVHLTLLLLHHDIRGLIEPGALSLAMTMLGYVLLTTLSTANALFLLSWLAAGVGAWCKSQSRSVLMGVVANGSITILPLFAAMIIASVASYIRPTPNWEPQPAPRASYIAFAATPIGPVLFSELYLQETSGYTYHSLPRMESTRGATFLAALFMLVIQIFIHLLVRTGVLHLSSRLLNRCESRSNSTEQLYGLQRAEI
ncbi:MAG: hypothetical protein KDA91_18135 [Planctomycetaceae bacterium]|nr:hypothetical protein [Planctomycetaceae bacterium]